MNRHASALTLAILALVSCDRGSGHVPTAATPGLGAPPPASPPAPGPTRIIRLSGNLDFGDVEVGAYEAFKEFPVCNDGNSRLTITEIAGPAGYWFSYPAYWDYGYEEVHPGACVTFWAYFTPQAVGMHAGTVTLKADQTSGTPTFQVSGSGSRPASPRTVFREGRFLVGIGIAPGRYFSDPDGECYWQRKSTYPAAPGDDIAWATSWFDPGQWVVDILPSDTLFESFEGCGEWSQTPGRGIDPNVIRPGMWLVRDQVPQGHYRADARPGCFWERLRNFEGTPGGVIESGSTNQPQQITVSIRSTDVGFHTNETCGRWTRVS
jgi:hypothetical protein